MFSNFIHNCFILFLFTITLSTFSIYMYIFSTKIICDNNGGGTVAITGQNVLIFHSRYQLMPNPDYFEIKTRTGVDGTTEVDLIVREPGLDRELVNQYQFQLVAYDGGSPAKLDSMLLNITIGLYHCVCHCGRVG